MSEPGEATPHHVVQKPRKRTGNVQVSDFTMMVKVPGRPQAIRVFTATEDAEARQYANARAEPLCLCLFRHRTATSSAPMGTSLRSQPCRSPAWPPTAVRSTLPGTDSRLRAS